MEESGRSRREKFDLLFLKFSAECNGLGLIFHANQEITKSWLKLKLFMKRHICGSCHVRVKREVKNPQAVTKEKWCSEFDSLLLSKGKRRSRKVFLRVPLI